MNNLNPMISVLMNCHNGEKFLQQSIESVINQSYSNFEIIFFDNQSNDDSVKIFNQFNDPRLKYFKSDYFLELSEARIEAWKFINGDFIAILDTDDVAMPNRFSKQIKCFLNNNDLAVIGGNCQIINDENLILHETSLDYSNKQLSYMLDYSFPFNNASLMFRKKYVDEVGGYPKKYIMINDYVLTHKLSKKYSVMNLKDIISKNRIHNNSLTNKKKIINIVEQYRFLKEILSHGNEKKISINNKIYISRYYMKIIMIYCIHFQLKELRNLLREVKFYKLFFWLIKTKKLNK